MSTDERSSIKNGIWLCENHVKLIDTDVGRYSAEYSQRPQREQSSYKVCVKFMLFSPRKMLWGQHKKIILGCHAGLLEGHV